VVNIVDLMALFPHDRHPHGMTDERFASLFTDDVDVVFAFHGYPAAVHHVLHGRSEVGRFHVRGYDEEGTTTTPFDMVVRNQMSRYHLALEALRRTSRVPEGTDVLVSHCDQMLTRHRSYIVEHLEDMPEVRDWRWSGQPSSS
jgi:xylulose-5-phosphate/fructose-6-phosphate phosphoketolase